MIVKVIEIRDRSTFIPALAIRMMASPGTRVSAAGFEAQRYLLARVGFHGEGVVLMRLVDQVAQADPHRWGDSRTMTTAHRWIERNFAKLEDGSVVDVEFILGEKLQPSRPESEEPWR